MNVNLLHKILKGLEDMGWNRTELALHSNIHLSEISRILNGKQTLSLQNLDKITDAFGLLEGTLYPYYMEECFNQSGYLDKRKSEPFLYKCVDLGMDEYINAILNIVLEERSKSIRSKNLSAFFALAEQLYHDGKEKKALPIYNIIIESMPDHFSEEVAISYFRRFFILRLTEEGKYAIGHVLEHIAYMPIAYQLESYLWITATYHTLREWEKTQYYARRLEKLTKDREEYKDYYGRAILYQSLTVKYLGGSLKDVMNLIDQYAEVNEYYTDLAIGNRFVAYLDFGQSEVVDDYLNWLEGREDIFVGLPNVLEAYVEMDRLNDAEQLLVKYENVIDEMIATNEPSYKQQMYLRFQYAYALYLFACHSYSEGISQVLEVADSSIKIGNIERFKQCLQIYWKYSEYTTPELEKKYLNLLNVKHLKKIP